MPKPVFLVVPIPRTNRFRSSVNPLRVTVTYMSKSAQRISVPAIVGRRVDSAYIFSDEPDAHGVVLSLDDGSDLSIEFSFTSCVSAEVIILRSEDDDVFF